jgi:hypothetical protein
MKIVNGVAAAALSMLMAGCASIVGGGSSQEITVTTNPSGASCEFWRHGEQIGIIKSTPDRLTVKRRKYDIEIKCNKDGFGQANYLNHSGLSSMVAGNVAADLILTAGLSSIVDSANGADNEYNANVFIDMHQGITAPNEAPPAPTKSTIAPIQQ